VHEGADGGQDRHVLFAIQFDEHIGVARSFRDVAAEGGHRKA